MLNGTFFGDGVAVDPDVFAEADRGKAFLGRLLGLAVGDAVGTALEFRPRGSFTAIKDMIGCGPFSGNVRGWLPPPCQGPWG